MLHSVCLRWEQEFLLAESEEVSGHAGKEPDNFQELQGTSKIACGFQEPKMASRHQQTAPNPQLYSLKKVNPVKDLSQHANEFSN